MEYADDIKGYGKKRHIQMLFQSFMKNNVMNFMLTTRKPSLKVSVLGSEGRLSILQPNTVKSTSVAVPKTLVTIFLDIDPNDTETIQDYEEASEQGLFYDRVAQEVIDRSQMVAQEDYDDSLVAIHPSA